MKIDATHKSWVWGSTSLVAIALLLYAFTARSRAAALPGGTTLGLAFGVAGFALMIFAGLLGARKKVPVWRVGRAQTWMRGHLWLGLAALPLILFHSGLRFGGPLTSLLMVLLLVVTASGIFGATLQHFLPAAITREAPLETIYDQIGSVRAQLLSEADERAASAGGAAGALGEFYAQRLRPYLLDPARRGQPLADRELARAAFAQLRTIVPAEQQEAVGDLENLSEEERQLTRQAQLHRWLHGWLLVHVPLSLALLLLGAVHAVMALRY